MSSNLPVVVKRPIGRPKGSGSRFTQEIADEICERIAEGETLVGICRTDREGHPREPRSFPAFATVHDWADPGCSCHVPAFVQQFARARLRGQQHLLEECQLIADTPAIGIEEIQEHSAKNGISLRRARKDMLGHRALQIDTRLKLLARMNPQLWNERLQQPASKNTENEDGGPDRLIIEGGLPDNSQPPPPFEGDPPA